MNPRPPAQAYKYSYNRYQYCMPSCVQQGASLEPKKKINCTTVPDYLKEEIDLFLLRGGKGLECRAETIMTGLRRACDRKKELQTH